MSENRHKHKQTVQYSTDIQVHRLKSLHNFVQNSHVEKTHTQMSLIKD